MIEVGKRARRRRLPVIFATCTRPFALRIVTTQLRQSSTSAVSLRTLSQSLIGSMNRLLSLHSLAKLAPSPSSSSTEAPTEDYRIFPPLPFLGGRTAMLPAAAAATGAVGARFSTVSVATGAGGRTCPGSRRSHRRSERASEGLSRCRPRLVRRPPPSPGCRARLTDQRPREKLCPSSPPPPPS